MYSRTASLLKSYRYFRSAGHAYIVGEAATCSLRLARAEALLEGPTGDRVEFRWEYEECPSGGPREWGWSAADVKRWERDSHECECLCMYVDGCLVDSLGDIWDASREYRRECEAEMLATFLDTLPGGLLGLH